jgi:hypothetical protein
VAGSLLVAGSPLVARWALVARSALLLGVVLAGGGAGSFSAGGSDFAEEVRLAGCRAADPASSPAGEPDRARRGAGFAAPAARGDRCAAAAVPVPEGSMPPAGGRKVTDGGELVGLV